MKSRACPRVLLFFGKLRLIGGRPPQRHFTNARGTNYRGTSAGGRAPAVNNARHQSGMSRHSRITDHQPWTMPSINAILTSAPMHDSQAKKSKTQPSDLAKVHTWSTTKPPLVRTGTTTLQLAAQRQIELTAIRIEGARLGLVFTIVFEGFVAKVQAVECQRQLFVEAVVDRGGE